MHQCKQKNGWAECTACGGRIHLPGCTTKKKKEIDCCKDRHIDLYNNGQEVGIYDAGLKMLESY